jgi:RHS repeat-associated protein
MCCFLNPAPRFGGEQFKADIAASRTQQVGTGFMNANSPGQIGFVAGSAALAQKSGYCYINISNESDDLVYFDNFILSHERSSLIEVMHYYLFGLTMAGIRSKAAGKLEYRRKFNDGSELESKEFSDGSGLELYSTEFRNYDHQIGRFHQVDPLAYSTFNWSPYAFVQNNPLLFNDPLGLDTLKRNKNGFLPKQARENDVILNKDGSTIYYNGQSWQSNKELENVVVTAKRRDGTKSESQGVNSSQTSK